MSCVRGLIFCALLVPGLGDAAARMPRQDAALSGDYCFTEADKTSLHDDLPEEVILERRKLIREFVLFNYRHLADDLLKGEGIYLDGLYHLYAANLADKSRLIEFARSAMLETAGIPDFARRLSYCN